jgi:hypothetical protein
MPVTRVKRLDRRPIPISPVDLLTLVAGDAE